MTSLRKTALVAGLFYLLTFVSIPTLALYSSVLSDPNYIVGSGPDTPVIIGGILEVIVASPALAPPSLYRVVKRQKSGCASFSRGSEPPASSPASWPDVDRDPAAGWAGADALVTGQALVAHTTGRPCSARA
jgi:hypothetical protein